MIEIFYENEYQTEVHRKAGISNNLIILKSLDGVSEQRLNISQASVVARGTLAKVGQPPHFYNVKIFYSNHTYTFNFRVEQERDEFARMVFTAQRFR